MNPEDIKEGKYYNLRLQCILNTEKVIVFETYSGDHIPLRQCDLERVTPVEERERYYVKKSHYRDEWQVWRRDADCASLNAEHREEQEND